MAKCEHLTKALDIEHGGVVNKVLADNPVKLVRIQPFTTVTNQGDVIVAIDDLPIRSVDDIVAYLNKKRLGDYVTIYLVRNENNLKLKIDQGAWSEA